MSSESMNPQSNSNPSEVGVDPMAMVRNAIATVSPSSITPETESAVNDDAASCAVPPPLPVTVLSGFLGAGKTTVLHYLLHNNNGLRIAIIVNDMAEVNIDANMLVSSVQTEEKMVALSNGCICCTLREDLFVELSKLATRGDLDHVIIESSGISEPLPVAETFTFQDGHGTSLGDVARLDTLVTVVDGASFLNELCAFEALKDRGWDVSDDDDRTVAQLFCDQLDFANVIVLNKTDLLDADGVGSVQAVLRRFNPNARIVEAAWGRVEPRSVLDTGLFDMERAAQNPEWLKEARVGEHKPETVEYGISSTTYRCRRPFNVERFEELTARWVEDGALIGVGDDVKSEAGGDEEEKKNNNDVTNNQHVLRAKGLVWLATQQSHWQQGAASLAGRRFAVSYGVPWEAAVTNGRVPQQQQHHVVVTAEENAMTANTTETTTLWQEPWGDRRTELVVIGQNMDHAKVTAALEVCAVTDEEMKEYTSAFLTSKPLDILSTAAGVGSNDDEELAARLRQFEIEVLRPKKKQTQVLDAAPVSTTPVSAHAVLAIYEGDARFRIQRYLRYAHLFPELASGLVKEFALPTHDTMDKQTSILADETSGNDTLSNTVAHLDTGALVELEWLQIRVEMDTDVDEDRYSIVEQCQKLNLLSNKARKALEREYPKPQIMIKKDAGGAGATMGSCNIGRQQQQEVQETKVKSSGKKGKKKGKKRR